MGVILLALLIVNSYFYVHNANLRARRNMGEMTIIKRISSVAQRALNKGEMTLEPNREELNNQIVSVRLGGWNAKGDALKGELL